MKKILLVCALGVLVSACSSDEEKSAKSNAKEAEDYSEMAIISLDTFDLDLKMFVPRYERAHNDYLTVRLEEIDEGSKWKISIGEDDKVKYSMYIEDAKFEYEMAKEKGEKPDLVAIKKKDLALIPHYKIDYLEETSDYMLYRVSIPSDPNITPWYEVFGMIPGNETVYKAYSDEMTQEAFIAKVRAEKMLKSIKSMLNPTVLEKDLAAN